MIAKGLPVAILATVLCWFGMGATALADPLPPLGQAVMASEISYPSTVTVDTHGYGHVSYTPNPLTWRYVGTMTNSEGANQPYSPFTYQPWTDGADNELVFHPETFVSEDWSFFAPGDNAYTITAQDYMFNSYETLTVHTFYDDTLHASTFTGFSAVRTNTLWRTPVRFTGRLARVDGGPITDRDDLQWEYDEFVSGNASGDYMGGNVCLQYSRDNVTWGTFGDDDQIWTDIEPTRGIIEPGSLEASAVVLDRAHTYEEFVPKNGWYRLYFYQGVPSPDSNTMANGLGPSMHLTFAPEWAYTRTQVSALSLAYGRSLAIHQRLYPVQVAGQGKTSVQRRTGGTWRAYKTYRAVRTNDMWARAFGKLFVTKGLKLPRGTYRARVEYVGSDYTHIVSAWSYTFKVN